MGMSRSELSTGRHVQRPRNPAGCSLSGPLWIIQDSVGIQLNKWTFIKDGDINKSASSQIVIKSRAALSASSFPSGH